MSRRLFPLALALPLLLAVVAQAEPGGDSRSVHARQPGPFAVGTLETRLVSLIVSFWSWNSLSSRAFWSRSLVL